MKPVYNEEIEHLYKVLYEQFFAYARSTLENDSLAEEAVQETFWIACAKPEALCSSPNPEGWLVLTLRNVICNMQRRRATANRVLTEYVSAQVREFAVSEDRIGFEILYENVADLEEFQLIKEMVLEGKSQLEMAREREISLDTCKKRVQRAKEKLRKKIKI